jgi:hypothetical protein
MGYLLVGGRFSQGFRASEVELVSLTGYLLVGGAKGSVKALLRLS